MIFPRAPLMQERVEPEDDFADLGAEPVGFDDLGASDVQPENPPALDLQGTDQQPDRTVQTGHRRRVTELSEQTGLEAPGTPMRGQVVEYRDVRPETGFERFVEDTSRAQGAYMPQVANWFGIDMPSAQSAANMTRPNAPDESQGMSDRISALVPTARLPEGMGISESDERTQAAPLALGRMIPLVGEHWDEMQGAFDAAGGGDYRESRNMARAMQERGQRQAPEASLVGGAVPALALGLAGGPTAPTAFGRIGQVGAVGAGLGVASGAGQAEELEDVPREAATQGALGGAMAAGMQGVGEGAARVPGLLSRLFNRGADRATAAATPSRLEATGIWGARARNAVNEMPGGEEALAGDLQRLGIGHDLRNPSPTNAGPGGAANRFPRSEYSMSDASEVQQMAGQRLQTVAAQMDAAAEQARSAPVEMLGGPYRSAPATPSALATDPGRVDIRPVIAQMEQVASDVERLPIGGPRVAEALRSQVIAPLAGHADDGMSFTDAWEQRRLLDDMITGWEADPSLTTASGRLQTARRAFSQSMDAATEGLSPETQATWRQANRDYSVASLVAEHGRGAQRLSVGGGMGGAVGTAIENATGHVPVVGAWAQRELAQQSRMMWPGVRAVSLERMAPILRSLGGAAARFAPMLEQAAARSPAALAGTHFILSQTNPQYRQAVEQAEEQQDQGQ